VLFDLDGTLVDTAPDIASALGATLGELGRPPLPLDAVKALVGDGARELIRRAVGPATPEPELDRLLGRFVSHYEDGVCVASRPYPGVVEGMEALRRARIGFAVITNKPGALARSLLATLALDDGLLAVIGDGDGFPRKPDPSAARALIARAATTAAGTAVVGDGLPDLRMARAVGAVAIAAAWGYVSAERLGAESPDLLATTPGEAIRLILENRQ
jgi:phosphoglycolate phosphatase